MDRMKPHAMKPVAPMNSLVAMAVVYKNAGAATATMTVEIKATNKDVRRLPVRRKRTSSARTISASPTSGVVTASPIVQTDRMNEVATTPFVLFRYVYKPNSNATIASPASTKAGFVMAASTARMVTMKSRHIVKMSLAARINSNVKTALAFPAI